MYNKIDKISIRNWFTEGKDLINIVILTGMIVIIAGIAIS